jgi:hypothetical protein
LTLE